MKVVTATSKEYMETRNRLWLSATSEERSAKLQMYVLNCDIILARVKRWLTVGYFTKLGNRNPNE